MSLTQSFEECRQLNRHYGTKLHHTLHLLPKEIQPHLHGIFAYDRILLEMLHNPKHGVTKKEQAAAMRSWKTIFEEAMKTDHCSNAYMHAVVHTCKIFHLPPKRVTKIAQLRIAQQKKPHFDNALQLRRHVHAVAQAYTDLLAPLLNVKHAHGRRAIKTLMKNGELLLLLTYAGQDYRRTVCVLPRSEMKKIGYSKHDFEVQIITEGFQQLVERYLALIEEEAQAAAKQIKHLPSSLHHAFASLIETQHHLVQSIRQREYNLFSQPKLSLSLKLKHYIPVLGSLVR